jgi:hypothetical protein
MRDTRAKRELGITERTEMLRKKRGMEEGKGKVEEEERENPYVDGIYFSFF